MPSWRRPDSTLISDHLYNQLFTIHGTLMLLFFATPVFVGFGNYFVPLQIGASDMAFARLNALSYWLYLGGAISVLLGFATASGAATAGWTGYTPLTEDSFMAGPGVDLWIVGVMVVGFSGILGAINFIATIYGRRAPGMTLFRMPLFSWGILAAAVLILFAFPPLTAALAMLAIDRHLGGTFFLPSLGGSAILWQHLFWFFGHPEVYIVVIPAFGVDLGHRAGVQRQADLRLPREHPRVHVDGGPVDVGVGAPHVHHGRRAMAVLQHRVAADRRSDRGPLLQLDRDHVGRLAALPDADAVGARRCRSCSPWAASRA